MILKPKGKYKFTSMEMSLSKDLIVTSRSTYGILDWIGDIGGLNDALVLLIKIILIPYTSFKKESFLLTKIFRFKSSSTPDSSIKSVSVENLLRIKTISYFLSVFGICLTRRNRFKKMMVKSQKSLRKEMDLQKFIMRQRLSTVAILS